MYPLPENHYRRICPTLITNSNLNTVSVLNNLLTTDTIHKPNSDPNNLALSPNNPIIFKP